MNLANLEIVCGDGMVRKIQPGYYITFADGFVCNVEQCSLDLKKDKTDKIPERFFDITDRLLSINEDFINNLKEKE